MVNGIVDGQQEKSKPIIGEKELIEKQINLFTFLNQLQTKRRKHTYDKKIASAWIISQWLSMDKNLIHRVNKINRYQFLLPDEIVYEYYMSVIPAGKRYIKWIKKRKEDDKLKKRIQKLKENFPKLSVRECKMIITFLKNKRGN